MIIIHRQEHSSAAIDIQSPRYSTYRITPHSSDTRSLNPHQQGCEKRISVCASEQFNWLTPSRPQVIRPQGSPRPCGVGKYPDLGEWVCCKRIASRRRRSRTSLQRYCATG